jgi:hypothetical protein
MTQEQCLALPSHFTHENVCYPGSNATIQLHGLTMGATSVPEPGSRLPNWHLPGQSNGYSPLAPQNFFF